MTTVLIIVVVVVFAAIGLAFTITGLVDAFTSHNHDIESYEEDQDVVLMAQLEEERQNWMRS